MFPPGSPFNPQSPQQQTPQLTIAQQMLRSMERAIVFDRQLLDIVRQIGRDVSVMLSRQSASAAVTLPAAQSPTPAGVTPQPPGGTQPPAAERKAPDAAGWSDILDGVQQVTRSLPVLGGNLSGLLGSVRQFGSGTANLLQAFGSVRGLAGMGGAGGATTAGATGAAAAGAATSGATGAAAAGAAGAAGSAGGAVAGAAGVAAGGAGAIAAAAAPVMAAIGAVAAPMAALAAAGAAAGLAVAGIGAAAMQAGEAILGMAQAASKYVEAFAPSTVMAFNLAMRDLNATIGVALQPIVQTGTAFSRMLASTLLPISKQLAGIFEQLSKSILSVAGTALDAFGKVMEEVIPIVESVVGIIKDAVAPVLNAVIPVIGKLVAAVMPVVRLFVDMLAPSLKLIANLLAGLAPIFDAVGVVLRGFVEGVSSILRSIGSALGLGGLGDAFSSLKNVMRDVARYGMLAAAAMAKTWMGRLVGGDRFVAGMIKALEPAKKEDATGIAAVKNAQFQSFADFGKSVSIAASTASGKYGAPTPEEEDAAYKAETLRQLKEIADGRSLLQVIAESVDRIRIEVARPGYDGRRPDHGFDRRPDYGFGPVAGVANPIR